MSINNEEFEVVTVCDVPMLFCCGRVDRKEIPTSLFVFDVRHDDDCQGIPCEIAPYIMVNHWGTLISKISFADLLRIWKEKYPGCDNNSKTVLLYEDDWNYTGNFLSIKQYIAI